MNNITVSIIIPVYNAKKHLRECLNSCLSQTLGPVEIICIDDGSTDGTVDILKQYGRENENVVILSQKNQGAGVARNSGLAHAKGQFIAFMDSDDYYPDKDVLKKLYCTALREGVQICGGSALFLKDGIQRFCFLENQKICYRDFQNESGFGFPRFIYERKFLKEHGIQFPPYRSNEDPPFLVKAMAKAGIFYVITDCVYMIRNTDKIIRPDDRNILTGTLDGIGDILNISKSDRFEKLHTGMVISLKSRLPYIYKAIYRGETDIKKRYENLLAGIDETLLEQDTRKVKKPELMREDEICQIIHTSLEKEKLLMDKINQFPILLIYGAGRAGRLLYDYLMRRGYTGTVGFMVSSPDPDYTACGKKVKSIQDCVKDKDRALVIIASKNDAEQMEANAYQCQFKNVEKVSYDELMLFGADLVNDSYITIF